MPAGDASNAGMPHAEAAAAPAHRRRGARVSRVWWALVAVLTLATGASAGGPAIAAAALDMALARTLGAERVRVHVTAWPPALWAGRMDALTVAAQNLRMGALRVRSLDATLDRVQIDAAALYAGRDITIRRLGSAVARIVVSEDALQDMLDAQPQLRDARVSLAPGRLHVAGTIAVLGLPVHAAGDGRLVLRGSRTVDLVLDHVTVAGVPVPAPMVRRLLRPLNPVLDVGVLPFGLHLTGVTVAGGELIVDAAAGDS
jgi:hypothetical protein